MTETVNFDEQERKRYNSDVLEVYANYAHNIERDVFVVMQINEEGKVVNQYGLSSEAGIARVQEILSERPTV